MWLAGPAANVPVPVAAWRGRGRTSRGGVCAQAAGSHLDLLGQVAGSANVPQLALVKGEQLARLLQRDGCTRRRHAAVQTQLHLLRLKQLGELAGAALQPYKTHAALAPPTVWRCPPRVPAWRPARRPPRPCPGPPGGTRPAAAPASRVCATGARRGRRSHAGSRICRPVRACGASSPPRGMLTVCPSSRCEGCALLQLAGPGLLRTPHAPRTSSSGGKSQRWQWPDVLKSICEESAWSCCCCCCCSLPAWLRLRTRAPMNRLEHARKWPAVATCSASASRARHRRSLPA